MDGQSKAGRGAFITLEGGEGAGKTTQARHIAERLKEIGRAAIITREPGGSPAAEILRDVLLSGKFKNLGGEAEAIIFSAARIDHIDRTIAPALAAGTWVISDRFANSTRAYQGTLGGVAPRFLGPARESHVEWVAARSDDHSRSSGGDRIGTGRGAPRAGFRSADRFESEDLASHEALRQAYLAIAAAEPDRCVVIDATQEESEVAKAIWDVIGARLLDEHGQPNEFSRAANAF